MIAEPAAPELTALHDALREATEKARVYREQATVATREAEKWQAVADGIQQTLNVARTPAATLTEAA